VSVCKQCVREQGVQIDALQAAVSNLRDHYVTTKTAFETAQVSIYLFRYIYRCICTGIMFDMLVMMMRYSYHTICIYVYT
jgi:hypothetical protein